MEKQNKVNNVTALVKYLVIWKIGTIIEHDAPTSSITKNANWNSLNLYIAGKHIIIVQLQL